MNTYTEPNQEIKVAIDAVCKVTVSGSDYYLFIKRQYEPFKDSWALPGGFIRSDEELDQACERELREETNIKDEFKSIREIGVFGKVGRDPRKRIISIAFLIDLGNKDTLPEVSIANETLEVKWIKKDELDNYTFAFDHKEVLEKSFLV